MNFRIVLHLLKTDWQRLRVPTIAVWMLLLISAAPWLTHDTASFEIPVIYRFSSMGNSEHLEEAAISKLSVYAPFFELFVHAATALLSTAIGLHDQPWQVVSPFRKWQRILAKTLTLFLFVVLPQLLIAASISILNGFSQSFVVTSISGMALALMLRHGAYAVFGRCCRSFWSWGTALVCLAGLPYLLNSLAESHLVLWNSQSAIPGLLTFEPGAMEWVEMALSLILVTLLPRISRSPNGSVTRMAAAVVGIMAASCLNTWLISRPVFSEHPVVMASVEPALTDSGVGIRSVNFSNSGEISSSLRLMGVINATGQSPRTYVQWLASDQPLAKGRLPFDVDDNAGNSALGETLPGFLSSPPAYGNRLVDLGAADKDQKITSVDLTGYVYRYRTVADLPLGENRAGVNLDDITISARYLKGKAGDLLKRGFLPDAELSLKCPVRAGVENFSYFLYLPEAKECVRLKAIFSQGGESPWGSSMASLRAAIPD